MSWIITTRNPRTDQAVIIAEDNDAQSPVEFETEDAAERAVKDIPLCVAWGANVVEVP